MSTPRTRANVVDIVLDDADDRTKVTLTQSNRSGEVTDADRQAREDYESNWTAVLSHLKKSAER